MAWTPTTKVIDYTQLVDNLLAYIEEKDEEALTWAGISTPFAATYTNASGRLQTMFPSLMVLSQQSEEDLSGEVLIAGWQVTLECTVSGSNADTLVADTKKYDKAVRSMLANIPSLTANSSPAITASLFEIASVFDILRGQQSPSAYLQVFQIRATYQLISSAF